MSDSMSLDDVRLRPGLINADGFQLAAKVVDDFWQELRANAADVTASQETSLWAFADSCLFFSVVYRATIEGEEDDHHVVEKPVGIVYLFAPPSIDTTNVGTASIGIVLKPPEWGTGTSWRACMLALRWAFDEAGFHRVQACIMMNPTPLPTPTKELNSGLQSHFRSEIGGSCPHAIRLFTRLGMSHEGTRRRSCSLPPPLEGYADLTCLAILDTEWIHVGQRLSKDLDVSNDRTIWDDMFSRQAREREDLLQWEERQHKLKRSSSTETLRITTLQGCAPSMVESESDQECDSESVVSGSSRRPSSERTFASLWDEDREDERPVRARDTAVTSEWLEGVSNFRYASDVRSRFSDTLPHRLRAGRSSRDGRQPLTDVIRDWTPSSEEDVESSRLSLADVLASEGGQWHLFGSSSPEPSASHEQELPDSPHSPPSPTPSGSSAHSAFSVISDIPMNSEGSWTRLLPGERPGSVGSSVYHEGSDSWDEMSDMGSKSGAENVNSEME